MINEKNNDNDDLNEVKKHATQTFAAIERSFSRMAYRKRNTIRIIICLLFFIAGYQANNLFSSGVPTEKIIEKIAGDWHLDHVQISMDGGRRITNTASTTGVMRIPIIR